MSTGEHKTEKHSLGILIFSIDLSEILQEARSNIFSITAYWIGATDFETEDVWKWSTTLTMVTVTDWPPGQQDNYLGNQNCVQIMTSEGYRRDDNLCDALRAFVCEVLTF